MVLLPTVVEVIVQVPEPDDSVIEHVLGTASPSLTVTVPVGVPEPGLTAATVTDTS